jgi:hypothetical protein
MDSFEPDLDVNLPGHPTRAPEEPNLNGSRSKPFVASEFRAIE